MSQPGPSSTGGSSFEKYDSPWMKTRIGALNSGLDEWRDIWSFAVADS